MKETIFLFSNQPSNDNEGNPLKKEDEKEEQCNRDNVGS